MEVKQCEDQTWHVLERRQGDVRCKHARGTHEDQRARVHCGVAVRRVASALEENRKCVFTERQISARMSATTVWSLDVDAVRVSCDAREGETCWILEVLLLHSDFLS